MLHPVPQPGTVSAFLRELRATGAPVLKLRGPGSLADVLRHIEAEAAGDAGLMPLLEEWHREALEDLAGPPLPFDARAARYGAQMLLRAVWFYLHRDSPELHVVTLLADPLPGGPTAEAMFSADLTLQYLPDLHRIARTLAPGDPLLGALQRMADALPLSGAGVPPPGGNDSRQPQYAAWNALQNHAGLWRLFLDRVIGSSARGWLALPGVRESLRRAAGPFAAELIPAFDVTEPPLPAHEPSHF